jgi:hypothetical protein
MDNYGIAWILWGIYFVIVEGDAILHNDMPGTLSEHIWAWFCMNGQKEKFAHLRRIILLCFMAWLSAHFITGGKF